MIDTEKKGSAVAVNVGRRNTVSTSAYAIRPRAGAGDLKALLVRKMGRGRDTKRQTLPSRISSLLIPSQIH